ncbi:hypothetical protein [Amycolatopsis sp. CFH S0078]|uniref:hypothetical protein n=1 Tax=Amycolatopsis sp. CFH S0078 TaxID=1644108 RepID=UPI00142F87F9|nr:hypothetical protein [Amycolatopsis sp. CFH S0078]
MDDPQPGTSGEPDAEPLSTPRQYSEPSPDDDLEVWVRYVKARYPREGLTPPGLARGRR